MPEPRTVEELAELGESGARLKYLMFWGHQARDGQRTGPWCLSQWWPAEFTVDGVRYATAEHWVMAGKARLFDDGEALQRVLAAAHPRTAKAAGRKVRGFDEQTWAEHRFDLVVRGSTAKFAAHPDLRGYLLGTGSRILVEASPRDRIWGIGLAADDERAQDPRTWRGTNLLGFALMEARARLAAEG